ncbi:MAG: AAA family ATPase [Candidatus Binataceae bacterium]
MILKTGHVKNFKCVRDSGSFKIDENVTCLVGKNESGKTALLQALYKLNPITEDEGKFDELEFPRSEWNAYKQSVKESPADALITTWELEDEDVAEVTKVLGPNGLTSKTVEIKKGYYEKKNWDVHTDEALVVEHLLNESGVHPEVMERLREHRTIKTMRGYLEKPESSSEAEKKLLDRIKKTFGGEGACGAAVNILAPRLPKFVYIPEYFTLPGEVAIIDLKTRIGDKTKLTNKERVFLAMLDMIGASVDDLEKIDKFERLIAELEAASNNVSQQIFRYWSQNRHLVVRIRFDQARPGDPAPFNAGYIVRTRIENTRHFVTVGFDERSAGFVWFFSFLVWFSQALKNYGSNLIVLLDEPGLTLHARAQADLLRYIEEQLAPKYQVIYTAHSPFMIDPAKLLRVRTVEDVFKEPKEGEAPPPPQTLGTKVGDDVLSTNPDTVFPLQAALGYEITQTLFIGPHTILVEGPAEILYFEWFKQKLKASGRTSLDNRWVVAPCGGIDKIPAFLSLFSGNRLHVAVFTDFGTGVKKRIREVRESKLLKDGHVLTAEMYAGQTEADIEDVIGREAYIELVVQAYKLEPGQKLPSVRPEGTPERVVKEVEAHFRTLPPEVAEFDHFRPAEALMHQGLGVALPGLDAALDRFEKIFSDLNAMLT